jgi:hypothetical protein
MGSPNLRIESCIFRFLFATLRVMLKGQNVKASAQIRSR